MKVRIEVECNCGAKEDAPIGIYKSANIMLGEDAKEEYYVTETKFENFYIKENMFNGFRLICKNCNEHIDVEG